MKLKDLRGFPENPYPESIFPEPTQEQFKLFNKILDQVGLTPARYNGSMGRRVWKYISETEIDLP